MSTKEFWEELDVNYEYIEENWKSHYEQKLKKYLKNLNENELFDICEKFKILPTEDIQTDQKKKYIDLILNSEYALDIAMLHDFFAYKIEIINEHHDRLKESKKVFYGEHKNSFLKLFEIFFKDEKELKNLLIHHYWYRNATFSHKYYPSIPLRKEFIEDFENKIPQFLKELKQHNWKNLVFKFFGKISTDRKTIFSIIRQTGDKLIRNIDKNRRNKLASDLILSLDLDKNILEIRCKDNNVVKKIIKILEKLIRIYFEKTKSLKTSFNEKKISESIEHNNHSFDIVSISFSESTLDGNVPISIPASTRIKTINKSIGDLVSRKIVNIKMENIVAISVRYKDKIRDIELINEEDNRYFSLKKNTKINDSEYQELSLEFEKFCDIKLNERFVVRAKEIDYEEITNEILTNERIDNPYPEMIEQIKKLHKLNIIYFENNELFQCRQCRKTNKTKDKCTMCNSNQLTKIKEIYEIKLDKKKLAEYIISKLNDKNIKIIDKNSIRTWGRKYEFIKVEYESSPVFIYISTGNVSSSLISYFQRSSLSIIIINVGYDINKELINMVNFDDISLAKIVLDKITPHQITDLIKENVRKTNTQIVASASTSYNSLKKLENYNGDYFENDIYNLIRYIFGNAEKWGAEKRGKEIPEGLSIISYSNNIGINKRSFSWDCKFTKDEYDLNIDEKRKAVTYIKKLNNTKEIKDTSKKLNSYLIISNAVDEDKFNKFSDYIVSSTRWKGKIILLKLETLLYFYKKFNLNYSEVLENYNEFKKHLANILFERKRERSVIISNADIDLLFPNKN